MLRKRSPDGATPITEVEDIWLELLLIFIDHEGMKGWVGLVGWPIAADGLPTTEMVTRYLQIERRTGEFAGERPTYVLYHCTTQPTKKTKFINVLQPKAGLVQ